MIICQMPGPLVPAHEATQSSTQLSTTHAKMIRVSLTIPPQFSLHPDFLCSVMLLYWVCFGKL